jgi:hypothetical protein
VNEFDGLYAEPMPATEEIFVRSSDQWQGSWDLMLRIGPWQRYKHAVRMCMLEAGWWEDVYRPVKIDGEWGFGVIDLACYHDLVKAMELCSHLHPSRLS